ncbi:Flexible cuticle protein 12 [Anthophora plagiata]
MPFGDFNIFNEEFSACGSLLIAIFLFAAVAYAAPPPLQPEASVLVKEVPSNNIGLGGYNYAYELSDGQTKEENAELVNQGTENEALSVRGSFSWVDPQTNVRYSVNYVADENGFHPQGEHIPV